MEPSNVITTPEEYVKLTKLYLAFVEKYGYKVIYNGIAKDGSSSEVFLVMSEENKDNPQEPYFIFYDIFEGAPLSLDGFKKSIIFDKDEETFAKLMKARILGSRLSKSGVICGLLETRKHLIDEIYKDGVLKLPKSSLKEISHWINFKGAGKPRPRGFQGTQQNK